MTKRPRPTAQPSAVSHTTVGDVVVSAVNDGVFHISLDDIVGVPSTEVEAAQVSDFRPIPPLLTVNTFLIQTGEQLLLVDTGFIGEFATVGRLLPNLASIGIDPGHIDAILMTHMHPDHEAGLTDENGNAVFPNAELIVHEDEVSFWLDEGAYARASETVQGYFRLARTALAAYEGRTTQVGVDDEPVSGIRVFPTPGHTPGHTAWHVHSGDESLLIWGDVVHLPGVQLALPDAGVAFDIDYNAAAATRKRVLDQVTTDRMRIAGIHLDHPSVGRIVRKGSGYGFVPEVWQPIL